MSLDVDAQWDDFWGLSQTAGSTDLPQFFRQVTHHGRLRGEFPGIFIKEMNDSKQIMMVNWLVNGDLMVINGD